jgi:hypothetical protein
LSDQVETPEKLRDKLEHSIAKNHVYRLERQILLRIIKEQSQTILDLSQQLQAKAGD